MSANPILDNPTPRTRKYCPGCKTIKALDEFHINRAQHDGHYAYCKACRADYDRERSAMRSIGVTWEAKGGERWDIEERIASIEERNALDAPWGYSAFHDRQK